MIDKTSATWKTVSSLIVERLNKARYELEENAEGQRVGQLQGEITAYKNILAEADDKKDVISFSAQY